MASMSVSGVVSGMDWEGMIDSVIESAQKPALVQVNKRTNLVNKKSLFEEMKITMNSIQTSLSPLKLPSTYKAKEIEIERVDTTGSYKGVLTATVNADAEVNVYDLEVKQLARAQTNRSKQINSSTLKNTLGGIESSKLYINAGGQKIGIDVYDSDSLDSLKSRINTTLKTLSVPVGVTASVVDNKLMCNSSGSCGQVFGKNNKYNWATILEKALLKWESRFKCNKIEGIPKQHVTPLFTGNGDSFVFDPFKLYNSELRMIVDAKLREGKIIVGGFRESGYVCGDPNTKTVTGHAFSVMLPDEDSDCLFVMRNPWGQAGENNPRLDGKLLIPDDDVVPPLIDICIMEPGSQMAQYMKADLGEYTVPRFRPMYMDLNPTEEMLRRYNVKDYKLLPIPEDANPDDFATETDE